MKSIDALELGNLLEKLEARLEWLNSRVKHIESLLTKELLLLMLEGIKTEKPKIDESKDMLKELLAALNELNSNLKKANKKDE